ncbi:hypothetical protein Q8A67_005315 [Cirrhinus molitorella]|uniref:Caspase-1 n=1 Tax=Cirrhinus molitorella TaxID=172907 RepID=A0AA88QD89_9TELE|nr:hypothetical protein Q8A67_005315 [Cirrhinus molitorella]
MNTEAVISEALKNLVDSELKEFIWHLSNGVTKAIDPIPKAELQNLSHGGVADMIVKYYPDNAGEIAVQALRNMKQNNLAKKLDLKLKKVQQPVQVEEINAPVSTQSVQVEKRNAPVSTQSIQPDWCRPDRITPCSQQFKDRILTEEKNEVYKPTSHSRRKGSALLITNTRQRQGAEIDEANMEWLLEALGYSVEMHTDLSGEAIKRAVKKFSKRHEHRDADSTFVVIMSHGARIDNKDAILGVNFDKNPDDVFFVEEIFSNLNSVNCPALINKPKVILIQACRGGQEGGVDVKGGGFQSDAAFESDAMFEADAYIHKEKDFACFMSALPSVYAYRNPDSGSYFINYIVDTFSTSAHKCHIFDLFTKITSRMANDPVFKDKKQKILPCIDRTSLEKYFYLFPGL